MNARKEKCGMITNEVHSMLYLTTCALHGIVPEEEAISEVDLQELYKFCKSHSMTAIVCMALENTDVFHHAKPEMKKKWLDAKNKAIRKNIMLDAERSKLFTWMEEQGIWYMPLKGSVLKDLYPKVGMRQMSDNDILYDPAFQYEIRDYMVSQGYEVIRIGETNHDVYEKPPVYNFELHTALFGAKHDPKWESYYADVKARLLKDEGKSYAYHFQDEDFYIYMLTHAFKHYSDRGTGVRSLLDVYVYVWKKGDTLDWEYIRKETEKLGIAAYEYQCRVLSRKLFEKPDLAYENTLTKEERKMLSFFTSSGTYGTVTNRIKNRLEKLQPNDAPIRRKTRMKYYIQRLFPDMNWMKRYSPFCAKHPWSVPVIYVYRIFNILLFGRERLTGELQVVKNARKE
jgi:hypothetical protein